MTSALAAAKAGKSVVVTEKEEQLGGWLSKFHKVTPHNSPFTELESPGIDELISEVESNKNIKVITSCLIEKISGQPGEFNVTLKINNEVQTESLKIGAIVQATGWKEYNPNNLGELGYGKFENVITGIQLEEYIKNGKENSALNGKPIESITFIQCAGSRDEKHLPYCSSICCSVSLKQALYIREKYPDALIYIIYKDMRTPAQHEFFYKKVQKEDNIFFTKGDVR